MTSLLTQYQKGFPKHQTKMASRRRSRSGDLSSRQGSTRERSRSPRSNRHSQSPVHHRGREGGSRTTERNRHHTERARDEWAGATSRHRGEQDDGSKGWEGSCNRRNDRGGDSKHDRGGDSRSDRGDSKHDRGDDSRSDRRGDRRHNRGDNSRHDKDDNRSDRGGDRRRDRAGDNRHDRKHDRGDDSRHDRDGSRHDRDDSRDGKGGSRVDRAGDRRYDREGGSIHDRGSDKRHDKVDNMHDSGDRKHDKPEGSCNRTHRWTDGGSGRQGDRETAQHEFGALSSGPAEKAVGKEEPNFGLSGTLTADTNTYKGVVIQYSEPEEARIPKIRWRLYPFKGEEALPVLYIHRQSAYLIGRDRQIADVPVDHPSCSKQHCVLQYRLVERPKEDGGVKRVIRPYLIDLRSTNGTYINNQRIDPACYVELKEKDVIKFGFSSREYVLLHEQSVAIQPSPGQEEAATDNAETDQ